MAIDRAATLRNAEKLLRTAGHSKRKQMFAHMCIGLMLFADGDRPGARRHFNECVATHYSHRGDYQWSRAFLARMDRDPAWPRWMPCIDRPPQLRLFASG